MNVTTHTLDSFLFGYSTCFVTWARFARHAGSISSISNTNSTWKKKAKKKERKFKQWQINPPKICGTSTGFLPMASVLVLQVCDQLNYEDPYIRSRPICWVHLNPWKEWNIKLQLPLRRSYLHIKCVFPLFTSSFCVSFLSRVKMNSTN